MGDERINLAEYPKWMVSGNQSEAEKLSDVLAWTGTSDPEFRVSASQLQLLLEEGLRPVTRYYFTVRGLPGSPIKPTQWCRKLGYQVNRRVQAALADEISDSSRRELNSLASDVGNVLNWSYGFQGLLSYLRAAEAHGRFAFDDLVVEGRPSEALRTAAESVEVVAEQEGGEGRTLSAVAQAIHQSLDEELNVIVEGVAGSGKSHLLDSLRGTYDEVDVVVFHPSTGYEEFVAGLRPARDGSFEGVAGIFVEACNRAARSPERKFLLFIDEINRANTSRVFGDLLLPIEKSKRASVIDLGLDRALSVDPPLGATSVRLQTPIPNEEDPERTEMYRYLIVPDNLHLLGTMNSTDRSVGTIDLALRRRFIWHELEPLTAEALRQELEDSGKFERETSTRADWDAVLEWYEGVNGVLMANTGPDARLGHAYVFTASTAFAAASGLLSQLAEVIYTFNLSEEDLGELPSVELPVAGRSLRVAYLGAGLGRRPRVVVAETSAVVKEMS